MADFKATRDRSALLEGVVRLLCESGNLTLLQDFTHFVPKVDQEWFADSIKCAWPRLTRW